MAQAKENTTKDTSTLDAARLKDMIIDLVTVPEDVKVGREIDEKGVLLTVQVNAKDMGIIIGRNGVMANSIKTYMRALGKAHDMNIRVDFLEPDGSLRSGNRNSTNHRDIDEDIALGSDLEELAMN
jgi:hypothetical protein